MADDRNIQIQVGPVVNNAHAALVSPATAPGWTVRCVRCGARSSVPHPRTGCPSCGGSVQAYRQPSTTVPYAA